MNSSYWFEIAIIFAIAAVGNILMGHFEQHTPKWRRVIKLFVIAALSCVISAVAGRPWFFAFLGTLALAALVVHAWWLPRQGINGWTGEPRERYYALRGWRIDARKIDRPSPR